MAQRQADLNERLKELQSALEAAKDELAKQEIQRQLKRLRDQQQQILRDTDELQERMENEQNRERMAEARQQVQDGREHVRQASEALEQGRVPQALTEGTRAGQQLNNVRDNLRKQSSNQFSDELTEMRNQAKQLDENQDRLSGELDAWKDSPRQSLRDAADRQKVKQSLEEQGKNLKQLVERMRRTVGEAEETEPLLAKNLFDAVRKADEQMIPESIDQTKKLADAGFPEEASKSSHHAGEGIQQLRQGVDQAAKSVLGDETAALRLAQSEVDELANQINREIAQATGETPRSRTRRPGPGTQRSADCPRSPDNGQQGRRGRQQGQQLGQGGQQPGRTASGKTRADHRQAPRSTKGQTPDRSAAGNTPQDEGSARPNSQGGPGGNPRGGGRRSGVDRMVDQLAGNPNGPGWANHRRRVPRVVRSHARRGGVARRPRLTTEAAQDS